jgi:hypothetical protein
MDELQALAAEILEPVIVSKAMTRDEFSKYLVDQLKLIKDDKDAERRELRVFALEKAMTSATAVISTIRSAINSSREVSAFSVPVEVFVDEDQQIWKQIKQMRPGSEPTATPAGNAFSNGPTAALAPKTNGAASELKGATQESGDSNFVANSAAANQHKNPESTPVLSGGGEVTPSGQSLQNPIAKSDLNSAHRGDLNDILKADGQRERALDRLKAESRSTAA